MSIRLYKDFALEKVIGEREHLRKFPNSYGYVLSLAHQFGTTFVNCTNIYIYIYAWDNNEHSFTLLFSLKTQGWFPRSNFRSWRSFVRAWTMRLRNKPF
jgi:hypothetical protein